MSIDRRDDPGDAVPAKAAILGHPVHPVLVGFPIAFLSAVIVTDVLAIIRDSTFLADASRWLLAAGIVTGAVAAIAGFVDGIALDSARRLATTWWHAGGNAAALVVAGANLMIRGDSPLGTISPWGLVLSIVTGAVLGFTGWLGGELVYRHRIGVMARPPTSMPRTGQSVRGQERAPGRDVG